MSRSQRQLKILELIAKIDIETQDELVSILHEKGFRVTQATISRDIKEMGLIKVLQADGKRYKYTAQPEREEKRFDKYHHLFRTAVLSIDYSENIIVIKTESGGASSAAALIDRLNFEDVLGTVSGDDTIIVVAKYKNTVEDLVERLKQLLD